jgi:hypothetical protein
MFARSGFQQKTTSDTDELIHEDPDQAIQGGSSGQHYHLTAAQHSYLAAVIANPIYSEPVMTSAGEIVTAVGGDIVMVLKNVP